MEKEGGTGCSSFVGLRCGLTRFVWWPGLGLCSRMAVGETLPLRKLMELTRKSPRMTAHHVVVLCPNDDKRTTASDARDNLSKADSYTYYGNIREHKTERKGAECQRWYC